MSRDPDRPSVLLTGCSSGIGRATALHLAERDFRVFATARRPEDIADLAARGCRTLRLDLTDADSMRAAVSEIESGHGGVDALVNNAGYGLQGALEELPISEVRRQFETNLFGPLRLTQLVLPGMRRRRRGRIVNVSSVGGRITTPGTGAYHASKHALEALSDVLRFEVRSFGIDVVLVEPGAIRTRWVATALAGLASRQAADSPYAALAAAIREQMHASHRGLLGLAAGEPEAVARAIERALRAPRPRTRYAVPALTRLFMLAHRGLPDRVWDALMRRRYPSPGRD